MVEQDLHPGLLPKGFLGGLAIKNLLANVGAPGTEGSIPGLGRSPGGGHGNPLQFFFAWRILWTEEPGRLIVHGVAELDMTEAT